MRPSPKMQIDDTQYYRVASVEPSTAPQGAEGNNWCRYVLERGYAAITGWRRGSLREITRHAARYAKELNARSQDGDSRWAYRRKT